MTPAVRTRLGWAVVRVVAVVVAGAVRVEQSRAAHDVRRPAAPPVEPPVEPIRLPSGDRRVYADGQLLVAYYGPRYDEDVRRMAPRRC